MKLYLYAVGAYILFGLVVIFLTGCASPETKINRDFVDCVYQARNHAGLSDADKDFLIKGCRDVYGMRNLFK